MNAKLTATALIALAASLGSVSSFAALPMEGSFTVAEQQADAAMTSAKDTAQKHAEIKTGVTKPESTPELQGKLTREQVRAEAIAARQAGVLPPHEGNY